MIVSPRFFHSTISPRKNAAAFSVRGRLKKSAAAEVSTTAPFARNTTSLQSRRA
jgi:hypothetical protein